MEEPFVACSCAYYTAGDGAVKFVIMGKTFYVIHI